MENRVLKIVCLISVGLAVKEINGVEPQSSNSSSTAQWTSSTQLQTEMPKPLKAANATFCKLKTENGSFMIVRNALTGEQIALGAEVRQDTPLLFACQSGYSLKGLNNTICASGGRWTKELPSCISFCAAHHPRSGFSTKAYFELNGIDVSQADQFEPQTVAKISCAHSFVKPPNFENTLLCTESGWSETKVPCEMECGQPVAVITPFSRKGTDAKITEVPWHVGIYEETNGLYENICAGVLISPRVVISAAHCFFETESDEQMMDFTNFAVVAGKYFREFNSEKELNISTIKIRKILKVWTPANYAGRRRYYAGDLAILKLTEFLPFSTAIRPVCLFPHKAFNDSLFAGLTGKISTWNQFSASEPFSVLKTLLMSAVSLEQCNGALSEDLQHRLPADKICLVSYNEEAVACKGDSGSGFVVKMPHSNEFVLLGVVSFSPTRTRDCMHHNLLVATNVLCYQQIIEQFKGEDLENDVDGFDKQSYEKSKRKQKTCKVPAFTEFMNIKNIFTGLTVPQGYEAAVDTFYAIACESGYALEGNSVAICRPDGFWLDNFPKCVARPNSIPTATVVDACRIPAEKHLLRVKDAITGDPATLGELVPTNSSLLFSCEGGSFLKGANNSVCKGGNEWTKALPFCYFKCAEKQPSSGFSTKATFDFENEALVARIDCAYFYSRPKDFHEILTCTAKGWNVPKYACFMNCGRPEEPVTKQAKLSIATNYTEAPWHVDIYRNLANGIQMHICGGTLISPRFVVSAAHCFFQARRTNATELDLSVFSIVAGRFKSDYDAKELDETAVQKKSIKEIWTPDNYLGAANDFEADIAIIELNEFTNFTLEIRPACLYLAVGAYQNIPSHVPGRVAAWSQMNEPSVEVASTRQTLHLETMSHDECKTSYSTQKPFGLAADKFCSASYAPATSACQIKSGTGFVARNPDGGFALFGVVSYSPWRSAEDCKRNQLLVMTNALIYKAQLQEARDKDLKNDVDMEAIKT